MSEAPAPPAARSVPAPTARPATTGTVAATAPAPPAARAPAPGQNTPRRLRALNTGLLWLGVAFGVAGALTFLLLGYALNRAGASTSQLIRVQQVQTSLLSADATATNAFLVGGLEPPASRAEYDTSISTATALIIEAAQAEPADEQALAVLNQELATYAALVQQARANNRQGFPVGAQYLRNASTGLRTQALPVLDNLVAANSARAASQMDAREGWLFGVVGVLVLAGLVLAQLWLARRFRRTFNPWLVGATALVLLTWIVGVAGLGRLGSSVAATREGAFSDVNRLATARIQAYDAKSNESLTLIARGSGGAYEQAWAARARTVTENVAALPANLQQRWQAYEAVHRRIRQLDDSGRWDDAVNLATGTGASSANARFAAFDAAASDLVGSATTSTTEQLSGSRVGLVVGAVLTLLAGLAVAVLARRGVAQRLREYR